MVPLPTTWTDLFNENNGMSDDANQKIIPLGQGRHELEMIRAVRDSGYHRAYRRPNP